MSDDFSDLGAQPIAEQAQPSVASTPSDFSDLGAQEDPNATPDTDTFSKISTGASNALTFPTAGLAPIILRESLHAIAGVPREFTDKTLQELNQSNPLEAELGKPVGLLLPVGLGGKALAETGAAVESLAGTGILGNAAKYAAEAAVFQTTDELAKQAMSDPNQSVQTAATNIGGAGILGGLFGAAGGILGKGIQKASNSEIGQFVSDFKTRLGEHLGTASPEAATGGENVFKTRYSYDPEAQANWENYKRTYNPETAEPAQPGFDRTSMGAKAADAFVKSKLAGRGLGYSMGAAAGRLTGIPGMGYIGGFAGSKVLGPVLDSIAQPLFRGIANGPAFEASAKFLGNFEKGNNNIINAAKAVFDKGAQVIPSALVSTKEDRDIIRDSLEKVQTSPESAMNIAGNLQPYMPDHNTAVGQLSGNMISHLQSIAPKAINGGLPLDSKNNITKAQEAVYNRSLDIANQPLTILEHVKNGTVLPSDMATFLAIYPKLHPKMAQELTSAMINHMSKGNAVPYATRMGMSMFTGQPMDSTMSPQSIQATQATFMKANQPQQPQQAQKAKHSTKPLSKVSQAYSTPSQARQERALKD
jgi:hypothetical protein